MEGGATAPPPMGAARRLFGARLCLGLAKGTPARGAEGAAPMESRWLSWESERGPRVARRIDVIFQKGCVTGVRQGWEFGRLSKRRKKGRGKEEERKKKKKKGGGVGVKKRFFFL